MTKRRNLMYSLRDVQGKIFNVEKSKAELKRLQCHECHDKNTLPHRHTAEFQWSENAIKVTFIAASFYAAHTIARDPASFLMTIYVLLWLYGKVFEQIIGTVHRSIFLIKLLVGLMFIWSSCPSTIGYR